VAAGEYFGEYFGDSGSEIREIIDECRGKVGKEKRRNAQRLKGKFAEA